MEKPLSEILESILAGAPLGFNDIEMLASSMLSGALDDVAIAAILVALRTRENDPNVIAGFASSLRRSSVRVDTRNLNPVDTAGTGGDGLQTLNASTAAALVVASLGSPVLKHGNRGVSSRSGSADFLRELGYNIEHGPQVAECMIQRVGFAFLYAPLYHPAMKRVMPVRQKLGIRTVFNLVGPLANPGLVKRQVLGVARPGLLEAMSLAGSMLGYEHLLVVHGEPGIDEVSVSGKTIVYELKSGKLEKYSIDTSDLGLKRYDINKLRVSSPSESVERFMNVAQGRGREEDRAFIAANTAAALYVAGRARSFRDGVEQALQALDEGIVADYVTRVVRVLTECSQGHG